jgi:hypothetical protein
MRKLRFNLMIGAACVVIVLAGCSFPGGVNSTEQNQLAQTQMAMGLTQTAMVEQQQAAPEMTEAAPDIEEAAEVQTEEAALEISHTLIPSNPGYIQKWFYDTDSSSGTVTSGDDYVANLYERPFTESEMAYRPDVNIVKTEISEDNNFYYVTLYLEGTHPEGQLQAAYGVEIDANRDGRGDLLVIADRPSATEWDITGVSVHKDPNKDVGGVRILRPEAGYSGDGYEQTLLSADVLEDPDLAWARVSMDGSPNVTLAFKKSMINTDTFVWGVWAADELLDPALMDLHDHFTQTEAGSPYPAHSAYPLAGISLVDNTCRETYRFEAEEPIPGLCYLPDEETPPPPPPEEPEEPTEEPEETTEEPTEEPTEETTQPPPPELGEINGVAFDDMNNDGDRDSGEGLTIYDVTITLHSGGCGGPVVATTSSKSFSFSGLDPGNYCVEISPTNDMTTPSSFSVSVPAGGSIYVEFGYYTVI